MEFISDNVDEDIDMEYIVFETDSINLAENYLNSKMVSLLDDNDAFDNELDSYRKSEVSIRSISDVTIVDRNFEDKDLELEYVVKIKAKESGEDSETFSYNVIMTFEDGELIEDEIEVTLI